MSARRAGTLLLIAGMWGCGEKGPGRRDANAGDVDLGAVARPAIADGDREVRRADSLVRAGRPWRATLLLAPRVRVPSTAAPALRLTAARAAAGWNGWTEVERLLAGAPWLDSLGGEGRELLTRAALERGAAADAVREAQRALAGAGDAAARATRLVLLARALDRLDARDSAAAVYRMAAERVPALADWLRLRAAGVTADSAARAELFRRVQLPVARARIASTDAQALERARDFVAARRGYLNAGDSADAWRVAALAAGSDVAARARVAADIVRYLEGSVDGPDVRASLATLDSLKPTLAPVQELVVARAAAASGSAVRAVIGFTRAAAAAPLAERDRFLLAGALARSGRAGDAIGTYATITGDGALAALASYQRARLLLSTAGAGAARAALGEVASRHSASAAAAAPALLLLADLQVDAGDLRGAQRSLDELVARYPRAAQTPLARFRAALLRWTSSRRLAAISFDSLATRFPQGDEALAARYWAGRAYEAAGDRESARSRFGALVDSAPMSYYGLRAARRIRVRGWSPPTRPPAAPRVAAVDSAASRVRALQRVGMDVEARRELDALASAARGDTALEVVLSTLMALGEPSRALRLAIPALERGDNSPVVLRAAYPVLHADALAEFARQNQLDAALVAGLVRQESSWNPRALSPAGARGLMQLMPGVGAAVARSRGFPIWTPTLLYDPEVSLELGTAHLSAALRGGVPTAQALAAYNAGASRLQRWRDRPGSADPELFTEWIPFSETRDYVRIVLRNAEIYRRLYAWR